VSNQLRSLAHLPGGKNPGNGISKNHSQIRLIVFWLIRPQLIWKFSAFIFHQREGCSNTNIRSPLCIKYVWINPQVFTNQLKVTVKWVPTLLGELLGLNFGSVWPRVLAGLSWFPSVSSATSVTLTWKNSRTFLFHSLFALLSLYEFKTWQNLWGHDIYEKLTAG